MINLTIASLRAFISWTQLLVGGTPWTPAPLHDHNEQQPFSHGSFLATSSGQDTVCNVCTVVPPTNGADASPTIVAAFDRCRRDSKIVFVNATYNIESVMNITGLSNVEIDLHGTLVWSTNISYWLEHSLPVGYQNQSSAFILGGDNVYVHGNGHGTLDGNGQVW